ncbi:hypothetical protein AB0F73_28300 [Micromonospora purpureochromogenes]|uniref:hypothetical protein n=1 Tax=Micromonospora purpureochromogenes TaxID=47872 RepID=UPI0033C666A5
MPAGWDEGGWTDTDSDAFDTLLIRGLVVAATSGLIVALEPSGAGMAAAALTGLLVMPNVVDPEPWISNSGTWGELKNAYDSMHAQLLSQIEKVDGFWQDSAATQFHAFATGDLLPALERLAQTCSLMDSYCAQLAAGVITTLGAFLVATVSAAVAAVAANAAGPVSPAVKIGIFASWAAFAVAVIGLLAGFVMTVWLSAKTLGDANDELANKFADRSGRIDTASIRLPESLKIVVGDPAEWMQR